MGRPDSLEKISQRLADNGIEVEVRKGEGDVADTILAVARDLEPDVIVMAGRKRSPVGKAVFGSTSQAVILNAAVAVTVVE
jgi:nucleotide-binding universal stress UspA family protein